jgi:hypothetical protein
LKYKIFPQVEDLQHIYNRYVREAIGTRDAKQQMEELDSLGFLNPDMGKDMVGRQIVLFTEGLLPIAKYTDEVILRYIIYKLDGVSANKFVIVYAHGGMSGEGNSNSYNRDDPKL